MVQESTLRRPPFDPEVQIMRERINAMVERVKQHYSLWETNQKLGHRCCKNLLKYRFGDGKHKKPTLNIGFARQIVEKLKLVEYERYKIIKYIKHLILLVNQMTIATKRLKKMVVELKLIAHIPKFQKTIKYDSCTLKNFVDFMNFIIPSYNAELAVKRRILRVMTSLVPYKELYGAMMEWKKPKYVLTPAFKSMMLDFKERTKPNSSNTYSQIF